MSLPSYNNRNQKAIQLWNTYPLIVDGNYQMPIPRNNNYEVGRNFISTSNTKRANAIGAKMHKKTLATKATVTIKYEEILTSTLSDMYSHISPEFGHESFELQYFDTYLNAVVTKEFYLPDSSATIKHVQKITRQISPGVYQDTTETYVDITLEFIEM